MGGALSWEAGMTTVVSKTGVEIEIPPVNRVDRGAPRRWLARGWNDLRRNWGFSLSLGLLFVLIGYFATYEAWQYRWAVLAAISGFVLVAPFLAMAFYCVSRAEEEGRKPTLAEELTCWRGNGRSILLYALLLALVLIAWARFSSLITAFATHTLGGPYPVGLEQLISSPQGWAFIGLYLAVGLVVALAVFFGSVVSPQLMIDRKADPNVIGEARFLIADTAGLALSGRWGPDSGQHLFLGVDLRPLFPALFFLYKQTW